MRVFVIGFMGAGKSTIGRSLAIELGYLFVDLDTVVEQVHSMSIAEIFSLHGESTFRRWESELLRQCAQQDRVVISTGGGTPCVGDNMTFMCEKGLTIYLKHDTDRLTSRLVKSTKPRPLLAGKDSNQVRQKVDSMLAQREPIYLRSSMIVSNPTRDARRIAELVKLHIQYCGEK